MDKVSALLEKSPLLDTLLRTYGMFFMGATPISGVTCLVVLAANDARLLLVSAAACSSGNLLARWLCDPDKVRAGLYGWMTILLAFKIWFTVQSPMLVSMLPAIVAASLLEVALHAGIDRWMPPLAQALSGNTPCNLAFNAWWYLSQIPDAPSGMQPAEAVAWSVQLRDGTLRGFTNLTFSPPGNVWLVLLCMAATSHQSAALALLGSAAGTLADCFGVFLGLVAPAHAATGFSGLNGAIASFCLFVVCRPKVAASAWQAAVLAVLAAFLAGLLCGLGIGQTWPAVLATTAAQAVDLLVASPKSAKEQVKSE